MAALTTYTPKVWVSEPNPLGPPVDASIDTQLNGAALTNQEQRLWDAVTDESEALQAFASAEAAAAEASAIAYADGPVPIRQISGNTTLALSDAGKRLSVIAAAVVTIPPVSSVAWQPGHQIEIGRRTSSAVSVAPGAGVLLNGAGSSIAIATQNDSIRALMDSNNDWVVE